MPSGFGPGIGGVRHQGRNSGLLIPLLICNLHNYTPYLQIMKIQVTACIEMLYVTRKGTFNLIADQIGSKSLYLPGGRADTRSCLNHLPRTCSIVSSDLTSRPIKLSRRRHHTRTVQFRLHSQSSTFRQRQDTFDTRREDLTMTNDSSPTYLAFQHDGHLLQLETQVLSVRPALELDETNQKVFKQDFTEQDYVVVTKDTIFHAQGNLQKALR